MSGPRTERALSAPEFAGRTSGGEVRAQELSSVPVVFKRLQRLHTLKGHPLFFFS